MSPGNQIATPRHETITPGHYILILGHKTTRLRGYSISLFPEITNLSHRIPSHLQKIPHPGDFAFAGAPTIPVFLSACSGRLHSKRIYTLPKNYVSVNRKSNFSTCTHLPKTLLSLTKCLSICSIPKRTEHTISQTKQYAIESFQTMSTHHIK